MDTIFRYQARSFSRHDGLCRVRTFLNSKKETYVLLTDIGDKNPSASVTNAIEIICNSLKETGMVPDGVQFIEHYEDSFGGVPSFDLVIYSEDSRPDWRTLRFESVLEKLECDEKELSVLTYDIVRLAQQIDKIRYKMDPQIDFNYRESKEVTKRRFEIEYKSIKKESIKELIYKGVTEQELSRLLKSDLSVFGEIYSNPDEEYICFSEFPLGNGFVDYVVFTGRSRMDVYLIEVKGADFNLVNKGNYGKFASKIEEASGQLRQRLGHIYRDYEKFRRKVHEIRERVESGDRLYNSLIGPKGNLQVDPNKDINIYPVLIAGRTINDLEESRKRQDFEYSTKPTMKLETWDSWVRKLRRF
ncbi:Shedu immune nuclease family protein [Crassaminicella profunda]|uniref:Shedu immune nuclease family protein n=1 Tax=Crassaminicella profunda TaxID=1286698 RepID=UPI001FE420FF|nr:Shedu immune nuclease family protein [Crassaminicella profunda]